MHPRLYMQSFQYASYNVAQETIKFETRRVYGRRFHFILTKNQFLGLDDAILLIDKDNSYGHFPLGQNAWFYYNTFNASLYRETEKFGRVYFPFASFEEYKSFTHPRLLSLIRLKDEEATRVRRRSVGRERGRGRGKSTNNKRPSSIVLRAGNRSPAPKRARGDERKTTPRSTDDAFLSHTDEESAIFSKWNCASSRRKCDSISSLASSSKSLSPLDTVLLDSPGSSFSMEA